MKCAFIKIIQFGGITTEIQLNPRFLSQNMNIEESGLFCTMAEVRAFVTIYKQWGYSLNDVGKFYKCLIHIHL